MQGNRGREAKVRVDEKQETPNGCVCLTFATSLTREQRKDLLETEKREKIRSFPNTTSVLLLFVKMTKGVIKKRVIVIYGKTGSCFYVKS